MTFTAPSHKEPAQKHIPFPSRPNSPFLLLFVGSMCGSISAFHRKANFASRSTASAGADLRNLGPLPSSSQGRLNSQRWLSTLPVLPHALPVGQGAHLGRACALALDRLPFAIRFWMAGFPSSPPRVTCCFRFGWVDTLEGTFNPPPFFLGRPWGTHAHWDVQKMWERWGAMLGALRFCLRWEPVKPQTLRQDLSSSEPRE
jgi:hypothetical protein